MRFHRHHCGRSEPEIRLLAYWIFQHRERTGRDGTAEGDWLLAESVLEDLAREYQQ
jgi:hypothetical protein